MTTGTSSGSERTAGRTSLEGAFATGTKSTTIRLCFGGEGGRDAATVFLGAGPTGLARAARAADAFAAGREARRLSRANEAAKIATTLRTAM